MLNVIHGLYPYFYTFLSHDRILHIRLPGEKYGFVIFLHLTRRRYYHIYKSLSKNFFAAFKIQIFTLKNLCMNNKLRRKKKEWCKSENIMNTIVWKKRVKVRY